MHKICACFFEKLTMTDMLVFTQSSEVKDVEVSGVFLCYLGRQYLIRLGHHYNPLPGYCHSWPNWGQFCIAPFLAGQNKCVVNIYSVHD